MHAFLPIAEPSGCLVDARVGSKGASKNGLDLATPRKRPRRSHSPPADSVTDQAHPLNKSSHPETPASRNGDHRRGQGASPKASQEGRGRVEGLQPVLGLRRGERDARDDLFRMRSIAFSLVICCASRGLPRWAGLAAAPRKNRCPHRAPVPSHRAPARPIGPSELQPH